MSYGIRLLFPDGTEDELDEEYDTMEDAADQAQEYCSAYKVGGEILNMSNPGDYPMEEVGGDCNYEIFEFED